MQIVSKGALGMFVGLVVLVAVGCGRSPVEVREELAPWGVQTWYDWDYYWPTQGLSPVGGPTAVVHWELPTGWNGQPFQVHARRVGDSRWDLIATVTSCGSPVGCRYVDANVSHDRSYEYEVRTETRSGTVRQEGSPVRIDIPSAARPATPIGPAVVGLEPQGVFLDLLDDFDTRDDRFSHYLIFLVEIDGEGHFYKVGETDGPGFVDERAQSGASYGYRIAARDVNGHVSDLSPVGRGTAASEAGLRMSVVGEDPAPDPDAVVRRGVDQHGRDIVLYRPD